MEGRLHLLQLLLLSLLYSVQCFVNSPKIISKDGNLIFESGANRNITFQLKGNSRLIINEEYDVLDLLLPMNAHKKRPSGASKDEWSGPEDFVDLRDLADQLTELKSQTHGSNGLNSMLRQLQNRTRASQLLLRRLQFRLRQVESKADRLKTKLELDSCQSSPCENGGTCYNTYDGYRCQCRSAFEGTKCERDVNECALFEGTDLGCQNGGQCVNQLGSFSCLCTPGWHGMHCSQRKTDCGAASAWELCGHGSCVPSSDALGYRCICEPGWKSNALTPTCTEDIDECSAAAHTPCSTKCINLPGSFTCAPCAPGLTGNGVSCRDINECETNNGGCSLSPRVECINSYGSSHCADCPIGWTGDGRSCVRSSSPSPSPSDSPAAHSTAVGLTSCSQRAALCHPSAICSEISNTIICSCPQGMVGNGYGEHGCIRGTNNNCNDLPCLNGGVCLDTGPTNYTCMCPRGFRGPRCDPLPDPCTSQPCQNDGRCSPTPSDGGFVCQCRPGYSGRLCDSRFSSCNGMLVGQTGRLRYPPGGSSYQHNAQCAWVIRTNESQVLNVTFQSFNLEDSQECRFDWLQINDGRSAAAQIIGRYCGNRMPHGGNIISSSNQLYLWFRSDNSTAHEGFDLTWQSMEPQCGGLVEFETHGTLASPGSPGSYPKNRDCQWHLVAPINTRIKLTFFSLQLEQHESCNFDFVLISDALSGTELYKYCSSQQPAPLLLSTHEAIIRFHSDETGSDLGFQLHYSAEGKLPGCGGVYTTQIGSILSPMYTSDDGLIACDYEIRLTMGDVISIDFMTFELGPDSCLALYDVPGIGENARSGFLSAKHCGNSGTLPPTFNSLFNRVRIKFYTSRAVNDTIDRFELNYHAECKHTFDAQNGTIISAGYPEQSAYGFCTYKIITAPNTIITLKRIDFQLEQVSQDSYDEDYEDTPNQSSDCAGHNSLTINDGLNQAILGPFCDSLTPPAEYVSKTNMLILHLDLTNRPGRGIKFDYQSMPLSDSQCGGVYTKEGQTIRPPLTSVGRYHNDLTCTWIIMAPPGRAILLHWISMDIEDGDCSYDYVQVFDELIATDSEEKSPLIRVCGYEVPSDMVTHARQLTIQFQSDFADTGTGFELTYRFVEPETCGGHIHATTGMLNSPLYPLNYSNSLDCIWQLSTPPSTQMEVQFELFELDNTPACTGDWLEVRNGGNNNSALLGRFCGTSIPRRIPSFTHNLYLHFHTDDVGSARGFRLNWRIFANGCGGQLTGRTGVLTSPNYPNTYPNNINCEWKLDVHYGSNLRITIEDLEMENLNNCYDHLSIETVDSHSGLSNPSSSSLCRMPEGTNNVIILDSNKAKIMFRSDINIAFRGFRLSYAADCQVKLDANQGIIESLNYEESFYEGPINCSWQIRAPRGNRILLEISHFDRRLEAQPQDADGGLYVINGKSVIPIVGLSAPNISGDHVTVVHNTSSVNFRLEYRVEGCLYELRGASGSFSSLNYPKMYPNDIECYWQIHAPLGNVIELTVLNMDIEESVNCTKDSLVISNSMRESFPTERHCGHNNKMVITSAGHKLYVSLISDNSTNGRGFEATYRVLRSTCGGKLMAKSGTIQSPGYPRSYPANSDCEWVLEVSPHHTILFEIEDIEIESGYNCAFDKISAHDLSSSYDSDGEDSQDDTEAATIFQVCTGMSIARNESTTNRALLRFVTDNSIEHRGFRLHYHESCGQTLSIDETELQYITIAHQVARAETCVWVLRAADPTKHIIFTPTHVHLHAELSASYATEGDCLPHGIQIYEGVTATGTARQQFCRSHPASLISHGDALTISVPMLLVSEFEGHFMTMDSVCGSAYNALSGRFTTPYYPASYPVNIECEWTLNASDGNSLSLTIESFDLELSDGCNNDYLEVREESSRGTLIGVYCGTQLPPAIKSKGSIWMKFKSNDDVVGAGFMASYNYDHHNELNGTEGIIRSPHYPTKLQSNEIYSWRITVDSDYVVLVNVEHLIDVDVQHIHFYDGYTSIGTELVPELSKPLISNTNVMYITATRGPFMLNWERLSKEALESNRTAELQTRKCGHQLVNVARMISFSSPGYPSGYATNLHCVWDLVPANPAMHAVLQLTTVDLEVFSEECLTDYLLISSSTDMQHWSQLEKTCRPLNSTKSFHGQPYLRIEFFTDASVNKTGFESAIRTACGSELKASQGVVNITELIGNGYMSPQDCIWTIHVRRGKRIRITFLESQLKQGASTANTDQCRNFFVVRNGYAEDSPFLGHGKYCENNITDVLETSSNRAYIKFQRSGMPRFRAAFKYEELGHACSGQIELEEGSGNFSSRVISSPNFPNLPNPYSECVWRIKAPSQHRIAVEFINKFDLTPSSSNGSNSNSSDNWDDGCDQEFVQLNDGSTELMPALGRFCGNRKPDVIYSSGNNLRIKFFTGILEPRSGFQAIVKLADCGGSYYSTSGIINSPYFKDLQLHLQPQKIKECVYTIEMERGSTISMSFDSMHLPMEDDNCSSSTHLLLEEMEPFGEDLQSQRISDRLVVCGTTERHFLVETNKIVMRLRMPSGQLGEQESFQLRYSAISSRCGETITANQGVLQTPNYPAGVPKPTHCIWRIQVPKGSRVKVEILDFDTGGSASSFQGRLSFANDHKMLSLIGRYLRDPPAEIISTDNTMGIDAFLMPFSQHRGFKLRFTAYGSSECLANQLSVGYIVSTYRMDLNDSNDSNNSSLVYCNYQLRPPQNRTLLIQVLNYTTTSALMNNVHVCSVLTPLKLIRPDKSEPLLPRLMCPGTTKSRVLLPFAVDMTVSGTRRNAMKLLQISFSTQKCGGVWPLEPGDNMTITQPGPLDTDRAIDCAWAVGPGSTVEDYLAPDDVQLEVSVSANLTGNCEDHYLLVYNGPDQNSPLMGRYCNQVTELNKVVERGLFVEYHAETTADPKHNSTFNVTVKYGSGCGGRLSYPYRQIEFTEQYKNNVECIWEIEAGAGFHVGLSFVGRFYIENSNACTKDYLRVQQLMENTSNGTATATATWTDLQTICGREPPNHINSTSSTMRLIFRSDGNITGDGFIAHFERNCGGILYADPEPQTLSSPGYPVSYEKNLYCNYTFVPRATRSTGVLISFTTFDLERSPINSCMFDNVTITTRDNNDREQTSVLCGIKRRHAYRAQQSISLLLRTDSTFSGIGFELEYSTRLCGGVVNATQVVESPRQHQDDQMPHNTDCYWNLTAPEGHKFTIKFELLDLEAGSEDCRYDGIEVFASPVPDTKQRLARFCGRLSRELPILHVSTNRALIHSFSDDSQASNGFKAIVRILPNCDERIVLGEQNSSYTFNKYVGQYANDLDCSFVFIAPAGYHLSVEFRSFHVEGSSNCSADFLEFRDGAGPFADDIGTFCGQDLPPKLTSSRHTFFMRFVTNDRITDTGFELVVTAKPMTCGNQLIKLDGRQPLELHSPVNDQGHYDNNVFCLWKIESEVQLHLQFLSLDLEGPDANGSCQADYLKLYNSESAVQLEAGYGSHVVYNGKRESSFGSSDYATEHIYCGTGMPDDYYPNSEKMYVKFRSNGAVTKTGFRLRVVPNSGCQHNYGGVQGRVKFSGTADCDVYIVAPPNYLLSLYYAEVSLPSLNCDEEYVEAFDKATNKSLQRLCSYLEPGKSLFTQTNELRLHFKTGSIYSTFDMTYIASKVEAGPGCGGEIYNTEGLFTNPFYPMNVRNYSECRWTVRVPSNTRVLLHFIEFSLGSKATCHTDYLQFLEENDAGEAQEVRRFCGGDTPRVYLSKRSKLVLNFHKTVNYDGIGWVVKFVGVSNNYEIPQYMYDF
ncbi:cubilin homolog [Drosophila innubila]|uniref:cubilin homolog n=1 Tax=Drosophila innubila TaxID=198719 RepID=UPI00148E0368|nr:cubilin homolog [Drosophila innubila]